MKTWRIYSVSIGSPGTTGYKPRQDYGTIEGATEMRALDNLAARIDQPRVRRTFSIPVLGIGSLKVEEIVKEAS